MKKRLYGILISGLIYSLLLVVQAYAEVVVCFGDSITAGYNATSYSVYLQGMVDATIVNAGNGGEDTHGGVGRIGGVLAQHQPQKIIIMEGANDVMEGISPSTTSYNLENMLQQAASAGAIPILSTITPNSSNSGYVPENYNPGIISLASDSGTALVDTYANVISNWSNLNLDGVHPNDAGAKVIAEGFSSQVASGGDDDGGGGCFIATAAYGTILEPQVVLLKKFRDLRLLSNSPGRAFVKLYYTWSPPVADFIAQHNVVRFLVRIALLPLLALSYILVECSVVQQLITIALICSTLTMVWLRRSKKMASVA